MNLSETWEIEFYGSTEKYVTCFRKRLILDGKVSGFGNRYDTLEQLLKEAKQLAHINERKYEEVVNINDTNKKKLNTHAHS